MTEHLGVSTWWGKHWDQAPGWVRDLTMPQHAKTLSGVVKRQMKHTAPLGPFLEKTLIQGRLVW